MANDKAGASGKNPTGKGKEKQRGTQDELEIMALIVVEHPTLKDRIMPLIKEAQSRMTRGTKKE